MKHRRRLTYSIRALLVVSALIGIVLAVQVNRARDQERIVNLIQGSHRTSAPFLYRHQWPPGGRLDRQAEPPGPRWLRNLLGDHYFQTVRIVEAIMPDEVLL